MTLPAGTRLGPYEILAPLGAGGMGEVYRARDERLKRDVAIKVLPQSLAGDPDALARFEREALAVAALSHPNILSIFDFGTHDATAYAVMELLEGETLRGRLDAGQISEKQAVDYALQVVKGLSAAHEKGIVHRDLKPENLFVFGDGHLKILDFGLAKKVEPVGPGEETSAPTVSGRTEPGTVMGTVGYMSPEQVRGFPVDHRSDIFSFGAILYELLSGKKAFSRPTVADTMSAILKEEPPELTQSGLNVSPALDHIVKHCLEKDRDHRFQSARDIAFNLSEQASQPVTGGVPLVAPPKWNRKVLIAAAVVGVLIVAGAFLLWRPRKAGVEDRRLKRVAVLPFENLGAPEDDYFADGIADAVRGKLTSLLGIQVIARSSSTPYKKTTKAPNQIAQELDVGYLLTATVRWQKRTGGASRVEVSPELVEVASSGAPTSKWQQPFDAALTDVFQVQADIASRVAQGLGVVLEAGERKRLSEKPTENLAAYEAFLRGEEGFSVATDAAAIRKALAFYEQAVALDPGFAQAWARVSEANSALSDNGTQSVPAERAREAAKRGLALDPDRPEAYHALGDYELRVALDSNRAIEQYARGLRLAPDNAELLTETATAELPLGRWNAAVEHLRRAARLDPRSVWPRKGLGTALLWLRRYPEAREAIDQGLALIPLDLQLIATKSNTFLAEGDLAGARAVLSAAPAPDVLVAQAANAWALDPQQQELFLRLTPSAFDDRGDWAINLAGAHALGGDAAGVRTYAEEARKAYEEQVHAAPEDPESHIFLGLSLAYLGQKQEAIREGERGAALAPMTKNVRRGAFLQHQLVRIYMLVGEPEKALDKLEPLLRMPGYLSPGWLKIDPNFDPLRKKPKFQKLVAGGK